MTSRPAANWPRAAGRKSPSRNCSPSTTRNLDGLITAYCQQFGIGCRVASFLVLENENDYKRLNLEEERGEVLRDDLDDFLKLAWKQPDQDHIGQGGIRFGCSIACPNALRF